MSIASPSLPQGVLRRSVSRWGLVLGLLLVGAMAVYGVLQWHASRTVAADARRDANRAPELDGGVAWLNSAGPIHLRDLRGKVVLLDFWTLCCINCIHTLPDLARLEKKYPNELVIVGVHSAKFDNERNSTSIRKAILRYQINHPVVNDAQMKIWDAYGVSSWPTLCLIDPEGNYLGQLHGEGNFEVLDRAISRVIDIHRKKKTLDERPLHFELARYREQGDSALFFPGKVLADASSGRIFIADSTHHRIVITDLAGKKIAVAGKGEPGNADGPFDNASFNDPQGMALRGETLYVADRKNHLIRSLDLKAATVKTIAGTGEQDRDSRSQNGPAREIGLNSPWDLYLHGDTLYIAMAGHHQIWTLDVARGLIASFAGNGIENLADGPLADASFAQPSGLTGDGTDLYVADSEVSAVRRLPLNGNGEVKTIVGQGLFRFGDVDGVGDKVRLQHILGITFHEGKLYVADTYNSNIKVIDPATRSCQTLLGEGGGWLSKPVFNEPGGLSFAGDKLYVADTNAHRIRVIDLKTRTVATLALQGVKAPASAAAADRPVFPNPVRVSVPQTLVPRDGQLTLVVEVRPARGFKLSPEATMTYVVETLPGAQSTWSEQKSVPESKNTFAVSVPAAKLAGAAGLRISLVYYECGEGTGAVCRVKSHIWDVPLKLDATASNRVIHLSGLVPTENEKKPG